MLDGLGTRLRDFRVAKGLTQTALAEALGVSKVTVAGVESGFQKLSIDVLDRLAELGADLNYVVSGKGTGPMRS